MRSEAPGGIEGRTEISVSVSQRAGEKMDVLEAEIDMNPVCLSIKSSYAAGY